MSPRPPHPPATRPAPRPLTAKLGPRPPAAPPASRPWVLACWVALAAVAAYWPILRNGFAYDDVGVVSNNPMLGLLLHPSTYFSAQYFAASDEATYRPLVSLSYGIEYLLWGKSPLGSHIVNLLLHALASALLVPVCLSLGATRRAALAAGLLYAVHPLRSEAVCSVGFREDLLCAIFYLTAFALWPRFAWQEPGEARGGAAGRSGGQGRHVPEPPFAPLPLRPEIRLGLALVAFALALLSKEMALTFPFVVLAKDVQGALARWRRGAPRVADFLRRRLPWHVAAWALTAAGLWLFLSFHDPRAGFVQATSAYFPDASLLRRVTGFFWIVARYLWLFLVPHPLSVEYVVDLPASWIWAAGGASALGLAGLGIFCFRKRGAFPAAWQAFVAFLILLGPVSNLIRLTHPLAERYLTLPLAPLCYLAGSALGLWRANLLRRLFLAVVLVGLTLLSWQRCRDWESNYTLWGAEVRKGTKSCVAYNNYGGELVGRYRFADAVPYLQEAVRLQPDYPEALANLGQAYDGVGQFAQGEDCLRRAIALQPENGRFHAFLAIALSARSGSDEAVRECDLALRYEPDNPDVCSAVGLLRFRTGDLAGAEELFRKAIRINPMHFPAYTNLARLLVEREQYTGAIPLYTTALSLQADLPEAFEGLGVAYEGIGRLDQAVSAYSRLLAAQPNLPRAYLRMGALLLRMKRTDEARRCLEQGLSVAQQAGDSATEGAIRQVLGNPR